MRRMRLPAHSGLRLKETGVRVPIAARAHATAQCYLTPKVTNAPHDALFKTIFGQPEHAAAELQHILPGHIAARIDWSSLTPQPGTYVDEELADQHSDLLFSAAARPSHESGKRGRVERRRGLAVGAFSAKLGPQ